VRSVMDGHAMGSGLGSVVGVGVGVGVAAGAGAAAPAPGSLESRVTAWRLQTVNLTSVTRSYIGKLLDAVESGTLVAPSTAVAVASATVSPPVEVRPPASDGDDAAETRPAGVAASLVGRVRRAYEAGLALVVGVAGDQMADDEEAGTDEEGVSSGSGATPGRRSTKRARSDGGLVGGSGDARPSEGTGDGMAT